MAKEIKNAGALGSRARLEEACPRQKAQGFELIHLPPPWTPVYRLGQFEYASLFMLEEAISVTSRLLARFPTIDDLEVPRVGGRSGKGTMVEGAG
ncbi:MAG: hypothetical protein ISN28_01315 [Ectothiorhodospiraceae bacterium AqS1]|nr:hypothetical protein [Ectothiorhodospiraceae bacterium AqS1]